MWLIETKPQLSNSNYQALLFRKLQSLETARTLPTFSCEGKKTRATLKGKTRLWRCRRATAKHPAEKRNSSIHSMWGHILTCFSLSTSWGTEPGVNLRRNLAAGFYAGCRESLRVQEPVLLCEFWLTGWDWRCWSLDAAGLKTKQPN